MPLLEAGIRATEPVEGELVINSDLQLGWTCVPDGFTCAYRLRVELRGTEQDSRLVFDTEVLYELGYSLPSTAEATDKEIVAFAATSGAMAAWPFLREIVHNTSSRAGLQPIVLDVLRMPIITPGGGDEEER